MRRSGASGRTSGACDAPLSAAGLPLDALLRRPLTPARRTCLHPAEICVADVPALRLRPPQLPWLRRKSADSSPRSDESPPKVVAGRPRHWTKNAWQRTVPWTSNSPLDARQATPAARPAATPQSFDACEKRGSRSKRSARPWKTPVSESASARSAANAPELVRPCQRCRRRLRCRRPQPTPAPMWRCLCLRPAFPAAKASPLNSCKRTSARPCSP